MSLESGTYSKGLEGIIADETTICRLDGQRGKLYYRGYSIEDLARNSDFEEVTYLLLYEKLPTSAQLAEWRTRMRASREIPIEVQIMVRTFPANAHPMQLLQSVMAYLSVYIEHTIQHSTECNCRDTLHQVVQLASVIATYHRFRQGKAYVQPLPHLSHGGSFLHMMRGREPEEYEARIMDSCLVLHAEHGQYESRTPEIVRLLVVAAGINGGRMGRTGGLHGGRPTGRPCAEAAPPSAHRAPGLGAASWPLCLELMPRGLLQAGEPGAPSLPVRRNAVGAVRAALR